MTLDTAALTAAHLAVEDELVERRDSGLSIVGPGNGLIIRYRDGSPSASMRMGTREALDIGITAYLSHLVPQLNTAAELDAIARPGTVILSLSRGDVLEYWGTGWAWIGMPEHVNPVSSTELVETWQDVLPFIVVWEGK